MTRRKWLVGMGVAGTLACVTATILAQAPASAPARTGRPGREQLPQPVYRVAQQPQGTPAVAANTNGNLPTSGDAVAPAEHPLVPALQMAYAALNNIRT